MNFVNNIVLDLKDLYNAHNKHFGTGTNYEKGLYFFTVKHEINENLKSSNLRLVLLFEVKKKIQTQNHQNF